MQNNQLKIPEEFLFPPFHKKDVELITLNDKVQLLENIENEPFYYDILFIYNQEAPKPWENPSEVLPGIFEYQKFLSCAMKENFKLRKPNEDLMIKLLSVFLLSLFWVNKQPIKNLELKNMFINELSKKPVNCEERLHFIIKKPTQYHAFIQLQQLFIEIEKIFAKVVALKQI
ncbi:YpoC family protein [Metabacillus litoralis]|uniref:YpoC family protein n=1 Tax=Metabacillus litoralis TaxID=152268 RepID=UPI001CFC9B53|nr:hypothetical protein [Metabacillus litoralis]